MPVKGLAFKALTHSYVLEVKECPTVGSVEPS